MLIILHGAPAIKLFFLDSQPLPRAPLYLCGTCTLYWYCNGSINDFSINPFCYKSKVFEQLKTRYCICWPHLFVKFYLCWQQVSLSSYSQEQVYTGSRVGQLLQQLEPKDKPILVVADSILVITEMQLAAKKIGSIRIGHIAFTPSVRSLLMVSNANNQFIFFTQGWLSSEVKTLLQNTNEYGNTYLLVDPFNPRITFDPNQLTKDFPIKPLKNNHY